MLYPHEPSLSQKLELLINEIDSTAGLMFVAASEHHLLGEAAAILSGQVERLKEFAKLIGE